MATSIVSPSPQRLVWVFLVIMLYFAEFHIRSKSEAPLLFNNIFRRAIESGPGFRQDASKLIGRSAKKAALARERRFIVVVREQVGKLRRANGSSDGA
jgi:hypothetical protein